MIGLTIFRRRAYVSAIYAAGTTVDYLGIREVIVCWWIGDNEIRVVTKYVECIGIGVGNRPRDIQWQPRVHNADVDAIIELRKAPVARLIAVGIVRKRWLGWWLWTAVGKTDLGDAGNEIVLRIESGSTDSHDALRGREGTRCRARAKTIEIPHCW